ncbi:MAG TPA: tripartite tricarboxylate transporter substrate-binding protein [Xanthobacteraceae bacterium]|nr:tripartite tricarboxylate transporter substrate-binding protein [Xanthobacteraceae bacterium]
MAWKAGTGAVALLMLAALATQARSQSVADFYRGKQVQVLIGYSAGGGYDLYARMLARHMGKHIPGNPTLVPQNMPGAGSLKLANYLYSTAPKDGSIIGMVSRGMATDPLLVGDAKFDPTKFVWLGSITSEVSVCATWHTSPIKTWTDITAKEFTMGGSSAGSETDTFALLLRNVFGAKMRLVTGYPGGNDINLAMERGEVDGRCGWSWSSIKSQKTDWLKDKKINVLVQLGMAKHPDIPDVPFMLDLAKDQEQRQILRLVFASLVLGRPFMAPPGIPDDRKAALRKAFDDTMKDAEFLAEADKGRYEIAPVAAATIDELLVDLYKTPKSVAEKAAAVISK